MPNETCAAIAELVAERSAMARAAILIFLTSITSTRRFSKSRSKPKPHKTERKYGLKTAGPRLRLLHR
jgi:hypothetical protein